MGLSDASLTSRNPGGAPHLLPRLLAELSVEDAAMLRRILGSPRADINFALLRRELTAMGFPHSMSTLRRWAEEFTEDPERFA